MVDFDIKTLLLKKGIIQGHKTLLIPTPALDSKMIDLFVQEDYEQIFCRKSRTYIQKINHKPWNVFFELLSISSNEKFGFLWVIINDDISMDLTIHGGSWKQSLGMGMLFLDAWHTLVDELQESFNNIRTSCKINNKKAARFIQSGKFSVTNQDKKHVYFLLEK